MSRTETAEHYYLPNPDSVFNRIFYVTTAGHTTTPPRVPYPPRIHPTLYHFEWSEGRVLPEFGLLLITEGEGQFESKATGLRKIGAGSAVLLFPGVWHRYRPHPEVGWTEKWMHFNGEFAHALLEQKVILPDHPILSIREPGKVADAFGTLQGKIQDCPAENSLVLSLLALSVLTLAVDGESPASRLPQSNRADRDPMIDAALEYIWSQSHNVLSVADVADSLGVARRTLERRMRLVRGHGVLDEIIECRFSRAERLLRETDLPVLSVVNLAGFGSLENMRRVFVNRTKLSPAHYRIEQGCKTLAEENFSSTSRDDDKASARHPRCLKALP